jgi:hypothetical protein
MTQYKCFIKNKVEQFNDVSSVEKHKAYSLKMQALVELGGATPPPILDPGSGVASGFRTVGSYEPNRGPFLDLDEQTLEEIANYLDQKNIPRLPNDLMNVYNASTFLESHILDPNPMNNYILNLFQHLYRARKIKFKLSEDPPMAYFGYSFNDPIYKFIKKKGGVALIDPNNSINGVLKMMFSCVSSDKKDCNNSFATASGIVKNIYETSPISSRPSPTDNIKILCGWYPNKISDDPLVDFCNQNNVEMGQYVKPFNNNSQCATIQSTLPESIASKINTNIDNSISTGFIDFFRNGGNYISKICDAYKSISTGEFDKTQDPLLCYCDENKVTERFESPTQSILSNIIDLNGRLNSTSKPPSDSIFDKTIGGIPILYIGGIILLLLIVIVIVKKK